MNIKDAAMILGLVGEVTPAIVKATYKKLCSKYHPDRNPSGLEMMKSINVAYSALKDQTLKIEENFNDVEAFDEDLSDAINAVIDLEGVEVEVCGSWVWLTGDTKAHKDAIKKAGYFWASKKKSWFFRPANYKSVSRGTYSMDKIRATHGTTQVRRTEKPRLSA